MTGSPMTGSPITGSLWTTAADVLLTAELLLGAGSRRYRGESETQQMLVGLLVAGVGIAAVCAAVYCATRVISHLRQHSRLLLFLGLCRTHRLGRQQRGLLRQMARHYRLSLPARLFTEPAWFDRCRLQGALRHRREEIAALGQRLFGPGGAASG